MFFNVAYAGDLPLAATDVAGRWDLLYNFLVGLSIFFFVLVVGAMILFAIKYRHRPGLRPRYITGSHFMEGIFIVVPTVLLMVIFGWGYSVYHSMASAPMDAYEVRVIARQWLWQFQYENGRTTVGQLYVPMNRPVKMIMTSQDVIHSFFVPNFRIKQDVVPGMYSSVWFEARIPGTHQIFCAEYCGTSHSGMLAKVIVLTDDQWKAWLDGKKLGPIPDAREVAANWTPAGSESVEQVEARLTHQPLVKLAGEATDRVRSSQANISLKPVSLVEQGRTLFEVKGCASCHSIDGSGNIGPTQKGVFGTTVELSDGSRVLRDENYIRESIERPQAKIVRGYQPIMPTFQGQLSEAEMSSLIAYIKSLK